MLTHKRNTAAAKRFFKKAIKHCHEVPLDINTDKNHVYGEAIKGLKEDGILSKNLKHTKLNNNLIESDHWRLKRLIRPIISFKSFRTVCRCIKGL